jgi:peptidyl-prolyl cis-trans isomerase D
MFDFVREKKWVVRIFLALICIPFALWGIDFYQRGAGPTDAVANVDGEKISVFEFGRRLQNQQDALRQRLGRSIDVSMFDTPQMRESLLEEMLAERILTQYVARQNLLLGDAELQQAIAEKPEFQDGGQFSRERYQQMLKATGRTPVQFQEEARRSLAFQRLSGALIDGAVSSKALARQAGDFATESRDISELAFTPEQYAGQVKLAPDAAEAYYKSNPKEFELPEAVKAEFVVLNLEMIAAQSPIAAEEVKKVYDERYAGKAKQRAEARKKAEDVLAQLRKAPERFDELAKANSDDPGSKDKGGDLGFNPRGAMVKAFDDTVFRLKPGDISALVETEFGYHIIRVDEIKAAEKGGKAEERRARHILIAGPTDAKTLDAARAEIERDLRRERARTEFPKLAEKFAQKADQPLDSLKPIAEEFKLEVQTSDWVPRAGGGQAGALGSPRMLAALFEPDTLKSKKTTESIEVSNGVYIVARPLEHRAQSIRALEEARADIVRTLSEKEARALARKAGEERLAALEKGSDSGNKWSANRTVTRDSPAGLTRESARAVFRANTAKLPAYVGAETSNGGYTVYRVSKVAQGAGVDDKQTAAIQSALARNNGQEQLQLFVSELRKRSNVEINKANLERKGS